MSAIYDEQSVTVRGTRMRYYDVGKGPAVVVYHSLGGVVPSRFLDLLAGAFRVVVFALPGLAASSEQAVAGSVRELANLTAAAVDEIGLGEASVVGVSEGSRVALWHAIERPDKVDALALIAPNAILPRDWVSPMASAQGREEQLGLLYAHPERIAGLSFDISALAKHRALGERLGLTQPAPDLEKRLGEVKAPTLVVYGSEERLFPARQGHLYKAKIPNCFHIVMYDAGHDVAGERPEALNALVADFLERRAGFVATRTSHVIQP